MMHPKTYVEGFHNEDSVKSMTYNMLGATDMCVSALSLGTSPLACIYGNMNFDESFSLVENALKSGINMLDTAPWYGHGTSESVLGQILPKLPRKSYYINTKVGRYDPEPERMFDFSAERTLRSVDKSLQRMDLEYVDIIQVHDMEFAPSLDIIINETLPALQKVVDQGKARYIGITGYPLENYRKVLERSSVKIDTILSYTHYALHDTSLLTILPYLKEKCVGVINASPVVMGLLSNQAPPSWHPAYLMEDKTLLENCQLAAKYCQDHGVDIVKLAFHFAFIQPDITTTLAGMTSTAELNKNLDVLQNGITEHEKETLNYILSTYMKPLNNTNWDGIETTAFWEDIAASKR